MQDYFLWNGVDCRTYGIHVTEQPPITIPAERSTQTNVPGRPGSLTQLEGEDVYDDMILTATCFISDPAQIPAIAAWLKGSGTVTFANRTGGYYKARIANQIPFERCSGGIRTVLSRSISAAIHFSMPMPPLTSRSPHPGRSSQIREACIPSRF